MATPTKSAPDREDELAPWRRIEPLNLTPILEASLEAFYEQGFHGTTVRDIARRVGVTVPALYYHYDSKEGLLLALIELSTVNVVERAKAADAAGGTDPRKRLSNVIESITLRMTTRARLAALESEIRYLSDENRKSNAAVRKQVENLLVSIIEDGNRDGVFNVSDPAETTRALLGMCQSIPRWYNSEGQLKPQDIAERYVEIALKTVGAQIPAPTE